MVGFILANPMKALLLLSATLAQFLLSAQPTIQWQRNLGGNNWEEATEATPTLDSGYIVCGWTLFLPHQVFY